MSKIVTCFKSVIDENDISVDAGGGVSFARAQRKISDYEKSALEAGNHIAVEAGAEHVCLTFTVENAAQQVKDALSRGPQQAICVLDEAAELCDARTIGKVLAGAIAKTDDVRLVICADGSSDAYQKQTGPRIAAELGWPYVGNVVQASADGDGFAIVQKVDSVVRRMRVAAPCVVAVLPEICAPKTPGMRDILAAKKKAQTVYSLSDLGVAVDGALSAGEPRGFVMQRKNVMLEGAADEAATALVDALRKEGVL